MPFIADLHIHSHYSRATSKQLDLEHLHRWAQLKGIRVLGTGDIAHPGWLAEMKERLVPAEEGLFRLRDDLAAAIDETVPPACRAPVRFLLAGEISNIYKKGERVRKVHNVVFLPDFDAVERFQARLAAIGNIESDGRPILGLDSRDLLEITLECDSRAYLIPAHIWTPWFSALGSQSGFDSIEECFADLTDQIFAVETGLSSDPPMNWRLSSLDRFTLVSNSDAHSMQKLAREANVFDCELSYPAIADAMRTADPERFLGTIEFFPEEGKYHFDGHRKCQARLHPRETRNHRGLCPVCGRPVTVGVMYRVEELADREEGARSPRARPYWSLIPLPEVIAEVRNTTVSTKGVQKMFDRLLARLGSELGILMDISLEQIHQVGGPMLAEAIRRIRAGEVYIAPGYDGEFGTIRIFSEEERREFAAQLALVQDPIPKEEDAETVVAAPLVVQDAPAPEPEPAAEPVEPLNEAQRRAVEHGRGPLLIVAGPGTGKTRTLVYRIARLIRDRLAAPEQVLAVTFTNKAAEEMRQRLRELLGEVAARVTVKTFHALAASLLREFHQEVGLPADFRILSEVERLTVLQRIRRDLRSHEIRDLAETLSAMAARMQLPEKKEDVDSDLAAMAWSYGGMLEMMGALDYDGLLLRTLKLLQDRSDILEILRQRFRWILVDEYQDVNEIQYRLLRFLAPADSNLCVVGDPHQAIYGFRGSDRGYFLRFEKDYPEATVVRLEVNYRSTPEIIEAASRVIEVDPAGAVQLRPVLAAGDKITFCFAPTDKAEAEFVVHQIERHIGGTSMFSVDSGRVDGGQATGGGFSDVAVLARTAALFKPLREALERAGVPFHQVGEQPFFEHREVQWVLSYLRLAANPDSLSDALRVINVPPRGFGDSTLRTLQEHLEESSQDGARLAEWLRTCPDLTDAQRDSIKKFFQLVGELSTKAQTAPVVELINQVLERTGLGTQFAQHDRSQKLMRRLRQRALLFDNRLGDFLAEAAVEQPTDDLASDADRVMLLTLHAAKGLEFPVVFLMGCEEGVLPFVHAREGCDVDEERRLFYVGMTRAQHRLFLTASKRRNLFGRQRRSEPSRFLRDLPPRLIERVQPVSSSSQPRRTRAPQMSLF
jgi:uncharacterized protein (TIGR00375 family)